MTSFSTLPAELQEAIIEQALWSSDAFEFVVDQSPLSFWFRGLVMQQRPTNLSHMLWLIAKRQSQTLPSPVIARIIAHAEDAKHNEGRYGLFLKDGYHLEHSHFDRSHPIDEYVPFSVLTARWLRATGGVITALTPGCCKRHVIALKRISALLPDVLANGLPLSAQNVRVNSEIGFFDRLFRGPSALPTVQLGRRLLCRRRKKPVTTLKPAEAPNPAEAPKPAQAPTLAEVPKLANTPKSGSKAKRTNSSKLMDRPRAAYRVNAAETPEPEKVREPANTQEPAETSKPAKTPKYTKTPNHASPPDPARTPKPAEEASTTATPKPAQTPPPASNSNPTRQPGPSQTREITVRNNEKVVVFVVFVALCLCRQWSFNRTTLHQ